MEEQILLYFARILKSKARDGLWKKFDLVRMNCYYLLLP